MYHNGFAILYYNKKLYFNIIILWEHRRICGPSMTETSLCGIHAVQTRLYSCTHKIAHNGMSNVHAIEAPACLHIIKSIQIRPDSNSYKLRNDERRGMRKGWSLRVGSIITTPILRINFKFQLSSYLNKISSGSGLESRD
jgi:hypothetical protein